MPHRFLGAALAALTLVAGAACSSSGSPSGGPTSGVTITMWTRAGTQSQTQALVTAYNQTHGNHVVLTVYPNEQAGTNDGKLYAIPHALDLSVMYYD